jgi:LmbE family N-acetylglucosaminyl deacetylase
MTLPTNRSAVRRLLIAYAHPDDESFGLGGTIARYVDAGVEVYLICATNGEAGEVAPVHLRNGQTVAELRLSELACAGETLGISQVFPLGYRDSGMMGTPDNDHPESLWQADLDVIAGQVAGVIRDVRPHIVITFDPYGGYGHPDHIKMHQATLRAFHEAGDPAKFPEQIESGSTPFQPQKLYYSVFPRSLIRLRVLQARLTGKDPRRMGKNADMDYLAVLDAALPVHAKLDIRPYYEQWMAAAACHASQQSVAASTLLMRLFRRWLSLRQTFFRAYPVFNGTSAIEYDLFDGVKDQS